MVECLRMVVFMVVLVLGIIGRNGGVHGAVSSSTWRKISKINKEGPYLGIIVPNSFEMNPLMQSGSFVANHKLPYLDFSGDWILTDPHKMHFLGYILIICWLNHFFFLFVWLSVCPGRRFRIGRLQKEKVIIVMTGLSMVSLFWIVIVISIFLCFFLVDQCYWLFLLWGFYS